MIRHKQHIPVILAVLFGLLLSAAGYSYKLLKEIEIKGDFIRSDELGNVFVVKDNQLTKFDAKGNKLHVYSNRYAGDISFVDTHDPFKILIFYQSFGQIEFLDHTLSLSSGKIDLNQLNLGLSTLACASYQGAFWVYDPMNFELVRVDQSLKVSERSGNLPQATGYSVQPNYMLERDNSLYLNDPATGIHIFDKYGTYYKTIPVKGLSSFQVFDRRIIYYKDKQVNIYDTRLNESESTSLPAGAALSYSLCLSTKPRMLYLLQQDILQFYHID